MSSSVVIQTSFLGDVVLTTPLISALAARGAVDVVVTPAAAPVLAGNPAIRSVIAYDKRGADGGLGGLGRLASRLRAMRYDNAFLAQGSWRSAALALAARIPRRVGFATSAGRLLYSERVQRIAGRHHAEHLWRLSSDADAPPPDTAALRPRLYPGDGDRAAVAALLHDVPRDGATMVALAPGSIWGTKRWPHFAALAARLAPLHRVVVIGGAADAPLAAAIATAAGSERTIDATGKLSLLASAALIGQCAALVTNDSAPLHLASAVGTPTVAIFGPTVPAFGFGPLAPRHAVIELDGLACRPCDSHGPQRCPLGHWKCMTSLDAARVLEAVMTVRSAG